MKQIAIIGLYFLSLFSPSFAQKVTYSAIDKGGKDLNFEIIGKLNGNYLVYKNNKWKNNITIYSHDMKTKDQVNLDFISNKVINADFVVYDNFFYMIYQYQKKNIVYCMGVKMDTNGNKMTDPLIMDTTDVGRFSDNEIYSTLFSEDKHKIMVFKIKKKNDQFNITTLLFNNKLQLIEKSASSSSFDDRKEIYGDFLLDNEGSLIFTKGFKTNSRDDIKKLQLLIKSPGADTIRYRDIDLSERYIDEANLKVDNLNQKYIINSFYYKQKRGNIEGLYTCVWDKITDTIATSNFIAFNDTLRSEAKGNDMLKYAFDNYFIRQVIVKKNGGFLLTAENYSTQSRGINAFNRYDFFNRYPYISPLDYYRYSPSRLWFYRPWNSFNNTQNIRYFYDNILVFSIDDKSTLEWAGVLHKEQYEDEGDSYLSFSTVNDGGEIHFLFNSDTKYQIVADQSIDAGGKISGNATLKSMERGYQFMPKFGKQVGKKEVIIPCTYRGSICFAKVELK